MNGYRFWFDCETSGLLASQHQMLEFSILVEDPMGNTIDHLTCHLRLRHGIVPSPMALSINKINPFSKSWEQEAISEWDAAKKIVNLCNKYSSSQKPFFIAYKADFDRSFVSKLLENCGFNFFDLFNSSVIDPYSTAKQLISENKIKTKILKNTKQEEYPSGKLEDVAEAFGVKELLKNFNLHRSYIDCVLLLLTTKKLYEKALGFSIDNLKINPREWKENQVLEVITNSQSSGIKTRTIQILENLLDHQKIIALDFQTKELLTFNYGTFISKKDSNLAPIDASSYKQEQQDLSEKWQTLSLKNVDFNEVKKVESFIADSSNTKNSIDKIRKILSKNYPDNVVEEILVSAESYSLSLGKKQWTSNNYKAPKVITVASNVKIVCHPGGYYLLKEESSNLKIFNKSILLQKFPKIKLPNVYSFKQENHPLVIKEELEKVLDANFYEIALGYKQCFNINVDIPEAFIPNESAFLNQSVVDSTLEFTIPEVSEDFSTKVSCHVFNQKNGKIYNKMLLFKESFNSPYEISPLGFKVKINDKDIEVNITGPGELLINSPEHPLSCFNENQFLGDFYNKMLGVTSIKSFQSWYEKPVINTTNWENFIKNQKEGLIDNFNLEESLKSFENLWETPISAPDLNLEALTLKNLDHKYCPMCQKNYESDHDSCLKELNFLIKNYKQSTSTSFKDLKKKKFYIIKDANNEKYLFFCLNTSKKGCWGKKISTLKVEFTLLNPENILKINTIKFDK